MNDGMNDFNEIDSIAIQKCVEIKYKLKNYEYLYSVG